MYASLRTIYLFKHYTSGVAECRAGKQQAINRSRPWALNFLFPDSCTNYLSFRKLVITLVEREQGIVNVGVDRRSHLPALGKEMAWHFWIIDFRSWCPVFTAT